MARVIAEGTVEAGGQTYRLCVDADMVANLQKRTGWKPKKILAAMMANEGDVNLLRLVCHVALQRHHPTASIEVAGDILTEDMAGFGAVIMAGAGAWKPRGGQPGRRPTLH
ncbi:hypothetical protein [Tabrizicola sp.]|uniref:hypothetical protein n=1 Tax=Tabrizicola sp. TaxID=2005166 RepID=UPI0035B48827